MVVYFLKIIGIDRILDIVLTLATYNTPYEEKGTQVFARIFGIITCQVNGNYYAVRRNNEFLADQIKPNAKKYVVLAQRSNNNHASVDLDEKQRI